MALAARCVATLAFSAVLAVVLSVGTVHGQEGGPRLPAVEPVTVDPSTTALLVLDMSTRCNEPSQVCHELAPTIAAFLPRAREQGMLIIYTVSASAQGTELGDPWPGFDRRADEPVVYPDGFDKFVSDELRGLLDEHGIQTVIITGSSANQAVMYTVTGAARNWHYDVVIPVDGTIAASPYEYEYALHQLNLIQGSGGIRPFGFTTLDQIDFGAETER